MLLRLLNAYLLKGALFAFIAVILFGVVSTEQVAGLLAVFIGLRLILLLIEAFQKPISEESWAERTAKLIESFGALSPEERSAYAAAWKLPENATAEGLARAETQQLRARSVPQRSRWELLADAAGVLAFTALIPLDVGLATESFFSLNRSFELAEIAVLATCLLLYGLPQFRVLAFRSARVRTLWWSVPFFPALLVLGLLVVAKHPYLNPLNPEHRRLAAERVAAIMHAGNNVVAASHVNWVFRYAQDLEAKGEKDKAIAWYRTGLELDSNRQDMRLRLKALESTSGESSTSTAATTDTIDPYAPLWPASFSFPEVPTGRLDESLQQLSKGTVVLVPVGPVPDVLLASIAYVIQHELGLPVIAADAPIPLTKATRTHGLLVGEQWNVDELGRAFFELYPTLPINRIKYVLVTQNDIYQTGTNFVFSASYSWGAIISAARFIAIGPDDDHILSRTSKQALCALLKSFALPASSDRDCVTSYTRSLTEFDQKGNRPNARTLALFQKARAQWEAETAPRTEINESTMQDIHEQLERLAAPQN
jgi:hypothetical protein